MGVRALGGGHQWRAPRGGFLAVAVALAVSVAGCTASPENAGDPDGGSPHPVARTAPAADSGLYHTYSNPRFGFSAELPAAFLPERAPDNGDGTVLHSPDGLAKVSISGSNNALDETPEKLRDDYVGYARRDGGVVTFQAVSGNQVTVTGTIVNSTAGVDSIFYDHVFVGPESINMVSWRYPGDQKAKYDGLVTHSVDSFRAGDLAKPH